jgi:hypothetical protein
MQTETEKKNETTLIEGPKHTPPPSAATDNNDRKYSGETKGNKHITPRSNLYE